MTEEQLLAITTKFTPGEFVEAGSNIKDIDLEAFKVMAKFRTIVDSSVYFIFNGLTTGNHKSKGHPEGKAYDVRVPKKASYEVFKAAIDAGFNKIGIYWNGKTYSYHLEYAEKAAFWMGTKEAPGKGSWIFRPLILNPARV